MKFSSCPILLTILFALAACGQKGPLYLPAKPAAISTPYPTAESISAPAEDSDASSD